MLPVYIRRLGGSDILAGVVMASFFAAGVLSQYPSGRLADRIGRRPVLVAGLVTYGVASLSFLAPIAPSTAIGLRALQGLGAGAAAVASLAMISGSVAVERSGRAFAAIYGGELAGMAVGPLVGSIVGVDHMWAMFLASGIVSFAACVARPARSPRPSAGRPDRSARRAAGTPIAPIVSGEPVDGRCARRGPRPRADQRGLRHLLDAAPGGSGGVRVADRHLLDAVRRPVRARGQPERLAGRPHGPAGPGAGRPRVSACFCASYPFIHSVPALVVLGALEALGLRRRHARRAVAADPGLGPIGGRPGPGHLRDRPDGVHRPWPRRAPVRPSPTPPGSRS